MTLLVVPNKATGPYEVEVFGPLVHTCPFKAERDEGLITITYVPASHLLEMNSLSAYLAAFEEVAEPHEEITVAITETLFDLLSEDSESPVRITVVTEWETAGLRSVVTVKRP